MWRRSHDSVQQAGQIALVAALAALSLIAIAPPATSIGTVTIGSNLERVPTFTLLASPRPTVSNASLAPGRQAPGGLTSPVNGTVVRWRIRAGTNSAVTNFRVIRPLGGVLSTGAGTSASVTPPVSAVTSYEVQLPIQIGDHIGVDCCGGPQARLFVDAADGTGITNRWGPILADGGAGRPPDDTDTTELALNADIEPTSAFTIDKARAKKGGKVKVTATLPNPGSLIVGDARDAGIATAAATIAGKRKKRLKRTTTQVGAPGQITLTLKPTKSTRKKLRSQERLKARTKLAFIPSGGIAAVATRKVKLKP